MTTKVCRDNRYTRDIQKVKEALAEFKAMYTDGDLLRAFYSQIGEEDSKVCEDGYEEVVTCKVEGFQTHYYMDESFVVEMTVESFDTIKKIRFYCDVDLKIDRYSMFGDAMWSYRVFKEI